MKTSITNVSVNESPPVPPLTKQVHFNSPTNFSPINSFRENTIHTQYNSSNPGIEYLPQPEIISNSNNPNYNIILNQPVKNTSYMPYVIAPQLNRPMNPPPPQGNPLQYNGAKMSRSKFTPQEDATLKELVAKYGSTKWSEIAMKLPNRTGRQCRERWKNYLAPGIQNGPWSPEEDALLIQKVKDLGTMWSKMVQFFPGRTDVNLKNRWVTLRYKKNNGINNNDDDDEIENGKVSIKKNRIDHENDVIGNESDEENNNNSVILNNSNAVNEANIPVYQNFVNYTPYINYPPSYQLNPPPPPPYNPYYSANPIEYRSPSLQMYFGDPITIKESDFERNKIRGSYADIGTETENNFISHNDVNHGNSPDRYNKKKNMQSRLEPSIILSQPRWLLNHKNNDGPFNESSNSAHSNTKEEQNDNKNSDSMGFSKIKLNSSSFQQTNQPHDRLEVPLLVAMPLGTSS